MATQKKTTKSTSDKKPMRDLKTSKDVKGGMNRQAGERGETRRLASQGKRGETRPR